MESKDEKDTFQAFEEEAADCCCLIAKPVPEFVATPKDRNPQALLSMRFSW